MKRINYIRWFMPVLMVGYVLWQGIIATSSLEAVTDFRERTPYFDVLLPAGRVERTEAGIVLKQEPVYIDVRLPVRASSIALELKIATGSAPIKLGWQTDDDFTLVFSPAEPINYQGLVLYHYDLAEINYVRPGHKGRFIISSSALVPGSVVVKGASVSIRRRHPSFSWLKEQYNKILWN